MSTMAEPPNDVKAAEPAEFGFDEMQLQVGVRMQLLLSTGGQQYATTLIGYARGEYLMVRVPVANGVSVPLRDGETLKVRVLTGVRVFTFATRVKRVLMGDLFLLLLTFPERIHATTFRGAPRVRVKIAAEAVSSAGNAQGVTIQNLSVLGAMVASVAALGVKEDDVSLAFAFTTQPGNQEVKLAVICKIRNVRDKGQTTPYVFGLKFESLQGNDHLLLQNMVYERMLENRQAIV